MTDTRSTEVQLRWRASPLTRAIVTCTAVGLGAALILARPALVAFVAPMLGVLCSIGWQWPTPGPASRVRVHASPGLSRCFEGEPVTVSAWVGPESVDVAAELAVSVPAGMALSVEDGVTAVACTLLASRWGRYPLAARVDAVAGGGLLAGSATLQAAAIFVFPLAPPQSTEMPRTELPDRLGTHLTRHIGPGVEYADVRAYLPGDQLRTVNWAVSARRGTLHVTQRLTDRAADVVVIVDLSSQAAGPATAATERSARGAAQVVQSALRNGDRTGIVGLGGRAPRWLEPDIGRRQFYRVLDTVLGAGGEFESTTGTLAPRAALPPGAVVVAFSTLLDTEFALALIDLRKRGHTVVAIDILEGVPFSDEHDPVIGRMWALQRAAMYRDMRVIGVDVVAWPPDVTLDQALRLVPDRRRQVGRRR